MKFATQPNKSLLSPKNTEPEVGRHISRWPSPPFEKPLEFRYYDTRHQTSMKFFTQPYKIMLSPKNTQAGVCCFFQIGQRRQLESHQTVSFQSIMNFEAQTKKKR
jgi:hypothetical protein